MIVRRKIYNGKAYWYFYDIINKKPILKRAKGEFRNKKAFIDWLEKELNLEVVKFEPEPEITLVKPEEEDIEVVFYVEEYLGKMKEITEYSKVMTRQEFEEIMKMDYSDLLEWVKEEIGEGWITKVEIGTVEEKTEKKKRTKVKKVTEFTKGGKK